jgi:uncharacterized protein
MKKRVLVNDGYALPGLTTCTKRSSPMLEMRPGCECCDTDLPPESIEARICSFECTFCRRCADKMRGLCPNCGGDLVARPIRATRHLEKNPASTKRIVKPDGCAAA